MSNDPKAALRLIADTLYVLAVDAHAEGMALAKRSARIEQLSYICNEEEAIRLLADLQAEGIPHKDSGTNSKGGDA